MSLPTLPRMADFATWVTAAEPGLGWTTGYFLRAYTRSRGDANVLAVDASVIGPVLLECVAAACLTAPQWEGTAAELLDYLVAAAGETLPKTRDWPKTPRALSGELRRLAPALRATGMEVLLPDAKRRQADRSRRRLIRLGPASMAAQPSTPSGPSVPTSAAGVDVKDSAPFASPEAVDGVDGRPDGLDEAGATPSTRNPATDGASDGVDGVDGRAGDSAAADGEQWR